MVSSVGGEAEAMRVAVVGAGNRGRYTYGAWCLHSPDQAQVVAIAEPDPIRRDAMGEEHGIPAERRHSDWRHLLGDLADIDAVIIATLDSEHAGPAVALLDTDVDILLEKPIAPDRAGIDAVRAAAHRSRGSVTVAHVLRYTPLFRTMKELLDDGVIGELRGIEHAEHVALHLFPHAYVRGNWRREATAPMILSKACHDLDLLRWFADAPWVSVSSFGELTHFRPENAPRGAPAHCLEGCPVEDTCPFHAGRFYIDNHPSGVGHPSRVISRDPSVEGRLAALRDGPYGRCVYRCDNDVPDHQVALYTFANGVCATLTVTAFAQVGARLTTLLGTRGDLSINAERGEVTLRRFLPAPHVTRPSGVGEGPLAATDRGVSPPRTYGTVETIPARPTEGEFLGHGGGDDGLMQAFVAQLRKQREGSGTTRDTLTSLDASLDSHEMAFAAERSRHAGRIIEG